jgi:DNA repair photolyase
MHNVADLEDEDTREAYAYFMRTDPDMLKHLGPIETDYDKVTGRPMRRRSAKVGMIRGTKEENLKDVTVWLDPVPHIRQEAGKPLQGWYQSKYNETTGSRVRPCYTEAVLTQPYGGHCEVQCPFCYILAGTRGYRASRLVAVPLNYGEHVRKSLKAMQFSAAGYFSSFNDPFMKIEDYYHNTQEGASAFVDEGLPIFFLSRLSYPGWAFDLLTRNRHSYMQKSINTPHEDDWRRLSPGAATLEQHYMEIHEARKRGIYVSIQVNPVMAGIVTHDDIEELFERLALVGANHVIVKFVEANHPWVPAMIEKMVKRFGANRAASFIELFTEKSCGAQTTIQEEYRREGHERYQKRATACGMTYSLCYEYTKKSGVWASMGPEYLTAAQCHGPAVPMYVRSGPSMPFAPLGACPPSGCLICADAHNGVGACGSLKLSRADALTFADMRRNPHITNL